MSTADDRTGLRADAESDADRPKHEIESQTSQLVAARNAAVAADRARTAFFAAVSHDLRTPIHGVLAAVDQLREAGPDTAPGLIATIEASAQELLERLDELLALAQPRAHENLHPVTANIPDVLDHALSAYERLFSSERGAVDVQLDASLERDVLLQKAGFLRVVDALFAEFMLLADPGRVRVTMTLVGQTLTMRVTGFTAPVGQGSWDLVEQAVAAVDGTITVNDAGGVIMAIPAMPITERRLGTTRRVLLVDDTAVTRQLGQGMVRSLGYEVDVADGGGAAIAAVTATTYGLVLMDLRMPDMDGLTAARAIRSGEAGPDAVDTPIVALTAHAIVGAREEALMAGMDDFVTKPFSRQSLQEVLDRFLPAGVD